MKVDEIKVEMKASVEENFTKWMEKPATKLMVSLIPPSENPDALNSLLRSCFADAHGAGEVAVAVMMIEAMLKPRPDRDEQERRDKDRWAREQREGTYRTRTYDPYDPSNRL